LSGVERDGAGVEAGAAGRAAGGSLSGKVAVVTGGSRGYGAGIAEALAAAGAVVWIAGRTEADLQGVARRTGSRAFTADVTRGDHWDRLLAAVSGAHGRLDILVNNAGAGVRIAPASDMSDAEIEQALAVNLTSAILGSRRAAAIMTRQKSGTIVNISSVCAVEAWPSWSVYSAAKAGLVQFTRCLYTELRPAGARATCLLPSWGATDFLTAAGLTAFDLETAGKCIQPLELGKVVADICSLPPHLTVQEMILLPLVQEIEPL
jgi:NAD(P)-dependent dehydrogenase (short-subunit alcohol dehydrogenase family)